MPPSLNPSGPLGPKGSLRRAMGQGRASWLDPVLYPGAADALGPRGVLGVPSLMERRPLRWASPTVARVADGIGPRDHDEP